MKAFNHLTTVSYLIFGTTIVMSDRLKAWCLLKLEIHIVFTIKKIILQKIRTKNSWCLSKSKFPVSANFIFFHEEILEEFPDETDVDGYFYHNNSDISQSQHQIVRVSKNSNNNSFEIKLFQFCDSKTQQRYIIQEGVTISKGELSSVVNSLRYFLKIFDNVSKCFQIPLLEPKSEIGSAKSKDNLFAVYYNDIIQKLNRQITWPIRFGNNNSCVFTIKNFELQGNQFIFTEIVNLNHREIHQEPTLRCKQVWTNWEQLRCVAVSPLIVGMAIAPLTSLRTCFVRKEGFRVNYVCTKDFSISRQKRLSMSAMRVCVPCARNSFWRSNKVLFLVVVWSRGSHFWKKSKINSWYSWRCPLSWQVLFQQREMLTSWRLCNNSEFNFWLWKVLSLVVCSQKSLHVTRARKDYKNRQNTLFCWKRWTCYPTNNCSLLSHFNQPNIKKKELSVDSKVQRDYWR